MENEKCKKSGVIVILCWIIISFLLTLWIVRKVTPKDIFLGEYSCSYATINECAEKEIKPRATQEIQNNLQQVLADVEKINIVFQLPLKVLQFDLAIVERGSELQTRISEPQSSNTLLKGLDLICIWGESTHILSAYGRRELGKIIRLHNLNEEGMTIKIANNIMNNFKGCEWFPQKNIEIKDVSNRVIAPNATISAVTALKPYIVFKAQLIGEGFIFLAWFAIIGGLIALWKEIIQLLKKGCDYFTE